MKKTQNEVNEIVILKHENAMIKGMIILIAILILLSIPLNCIIKRSIKRRGFRRYIEAQKKFYKYPDSSKYKKN